MTKTSIKTIFLFLIFVLCFSLKAAEVSSDPAILTLDRIFSANEFRARKFGPARWLQHRPGYTTYTTLEPSETTTGGKDIVLYDPQTGKRKIIVPAGGLVPPGKTSPLEIEDYQWSPDGKRLLIFTESKQVWRQNTRGDYWVLNLRGRELWKLGGDAAEAEPSTLMFAKFSPDSSRAAYIRKNNLYVQDLAARRISQLTSDGSTTIINGTFDWVYEEEFFLRDGFRWSPDSKAIAYWQLDSAGVENFYLIDNTGGLYSKIIPVQYPKAGQVNSAARVGVVSALGGQTTWFDLPGDPRQHYIARMDWADNSDEIVFQRLNRLQNTNWLIMGNIHSGKTNTILTDADSAWVEVCNDLSWLENGKRFTWVSERDGWKHVYIVSRSGAEMECITPGAFDVVKVEKVDEKGRWLYYTASPQHAGQRYLFRTRLNGKERWQQPQQLTPATQPGTHTYQISPDAQWAIHTYSTFETPPAITLIRLPGHETIRTLEDNAPLRQKVAALKKTPVEFFPVIIKDENTGQPVRLDGWCMKPPTFDPNKKYPVVFYVYGEPWNQTVLDRWSSNNYYYLWHLLLTLRGYIVMSIDNRGTPAPRGREWRKSIYRQIGILASADQAAAVQAIIKERPYVDAGRIGTWGWSGGGSMALNAIFRYPDLYRTAIAVAPVTDQRYYDSIYQERYMGLPEDNKEGYKNGSVIHFAHRLKGNLLLVHGTGDDNVHFQNTEALIDALVEAGKQFSLMISPNRTHSIIEGKNTSRHLYELMTRFLEEKLPVE
ncbi:MAG: S9 family peptidase [Candidatus Aminicenantes bacterium]|nr:S9 family peptidase [Candidatus Aminicenantes bacterium]